MRRCWCCAMHRNTLLLVVVFILTQYHGGRIFPVISKAMIAVDAFAVKNSHFAGDESISTFGYNVRTSVRRGGIIGNDASLHSIGLIDEWIAAIKEETRLDEEKWRMTMKTRDPQSSIHEEDTGEWDVMMAEVDEELDNKKELDKDEYEELEEFQQSSNRTVTESSTLSGGRRKMQASGGCVQTAGGLQSAVRGSSPSKSTRITVCTQRMKLGSTARRRRLQRQPAVYGVTGGGINFSNRQIMIRCKYIRKKCILDGEKISRIFYGTNVTLYLIGFQFLNATTNDKFGSGSALSFLDNSVITIRDCSFQDNAATKGGGAILLQDSMLNFRNSRTSRTNFDNNQAQFGGAIYSINSTIQTILSDQPKIISLSDNQARDDGGAIYMVGGRLGLSDFLIDYNAANNGGAGFFVGVDVNVDGITISDNRANKTGGGLIFRNCSVKATNVNVTSNRAESDVGAILFVDSYVFMQIFVVAGNFANSTGGIGSVSSNVGFSYGIFSFNEANYDGGALTIVSSNVSFAQYTFLNNIGGSPEESNYSATIDSSLKKNCFASNSELRDAVLDYNGTTVIEAYGNISDWCVGLITDFTSIFQGRTTFNEDISKWDTSKAETMYEMFSNARAFNQDISKWDVSRVTDVVNMFSYAHVFNQDISTWNLANVMGTSYMFYYALAFNQDISTWDISKAFSTAHMFDNAISFNQDISTWDVSKVMNMNDMFAYATSFNQDISAWDVSTVTDMSFMFYSASSFNQDLSAWNIVNVENIAAMFQSASSFNQDLCSWNSLCASLTNTFAAFTGTSCPDTASDPVCEAGPFCFSC